MRINIIKFYSLKLGSPLGLNVGAAGKLVMPRNPAISSTQNYALSVQKKKTLVLL